MKKLILLILLIPSLLFAGPLQQAHKKVIAAQTIAGGFDCSGYTVFYAAISSSTLDCYDADDGSAVTLNGASATASGLELDATSDTPSISASDGNNMDYSAAEIGFTYEYTSGTLETNAFLLCAADGYTDLSFYRLNTTPDFRLIINGTVVVFSGVTNIYDGDPHDIVIKFDTVSNVQELYVDDVLQDEQKTATITEPTITEGTLYIGNLLTGNRTSYGYFTDFYIINGDPF